MASALLVVVAIDTLRWARTIEDDDRRFVAAPASQGLWEADTLLPDAASRRMLAVGDDVSYRRTLRLYWPVRPGQPIVGPEAEIARGRVQTELSQLARADADPAQRSQALTALGVLTVGVYYSTYYGSSGGPQDAAERAQVLRTAIGLFQGAIEADPGNAEAKRNLELLLRDQSAAQIVGDDPSGNAAEGDAPGAGRAGSGY